MLEKRYQKQNEEDFRNCEELLSNANVSKRLNAVEEGNSSICLKAEVSLPWM